MNLQRQISKGRESNSRPVERRGPMLVGNFTAELASAAFQKKGQTIAALLRDWPAVAGPALAAYTLPEKLTKAAPDLRGGQGHDKRPAHLLLKVAPSHALEVQYKIPQLIERINQALGYRAVNAIRLIQAPVCAPEKKPKRVSLQVPKLEGASRLDIALARMGCGVRARS